MQYLHENSDLVAAIEEDGLIKFVVGEHRLFPDYPIGECLPRYVNDINNINEIDDIKVCGPPDSVTGFTYEGETTFFVPVINAPACEERGPISMCTNFEKDELTEFDRDYAFICLLIEHVCANRESRSLRNAFEAVDHEPGDDCAFCKSYEETLKNFKYTSNSNSIIVPQHLKDLFIECLSNPHLKPPGFSYPLDVHHELGLTLNEDV